MNYSLVLKRWRWSDKAFASGWLCALLVLALLLAQNLGTWHAVVHPSRSYLPATHAEYAAPSDDFAAVLHEEDEPNHQGFFGRLFSSHHADSDCRVFDQLTHGDALMGVPLQALPLVVFPFLLLFMSGLATVRGHALFQARGPPSFL